MICRRYILAFALSVSLVFGAERDADGSFVMNVTQTAQGVVAAGSGEFNMAALSIDKPLSDYASVGPSTDTLVSGPAVPVTDEGFYTASGPSNLGTGQWSPPFGATTGSGDIVGLSNGFIVVPLGYVSGTELSDTCLFYELTFNYLGLTQGQYVYTWGSGPTADSLTINIGTPVPEPASVAVAAIPTVALLRRRQRRLSI